MIYGVSLGVRADRATIGLADAAGHASVRDELAQPPACTTGFMHFQDRALSESSLGPCMCHPLPLSLRPLRPLPPPLLLALLLAVCEMTIVPDSLDEKLDTLDLPPLL